MSYFLMLIIEKLYPDISVQSFKRRRKPNISTLKRYHQFKEIRR